LRAYSLAIFVNAIISPSLSDARALSTWHSDNRPTSGDISAHTLLAPPGDNFRHGSKKKIQAAECLIRT
jgi:hypothetical protein